MPSPQDQAHLPPPEPNVSAPRRRRAPSVAEQTRRRTWAAEWGKVGKDWKQKQLAKERAWHR